MKIYLSIFFLCLIFNKALSIETKIIYQIQNEIITSVDIKNEFKYILALNNKLKKIEKEKILNISSESAIREKIKKIEISKNFKKIKINNEYLNLLLKNTYSRLNLQSLEEFKLYLKNYDLNLEDVEKKITIDALWNELIIQKYASQIKINENQIRDKISKNNNILIEEYKLSEIVFEIENKDDLQKKYDEIIKNIAEIGFENSASIYSVSQSAKMGGDIGWINENSLNSKIKKNIKYLQINEISNPIILSTGILILKVVERKSSKIDIDLEAEFEKAINFERNRQLNQYSKIYYNKIKKNLNFNE